MRIASPVSLVMASTLAATLTVSPITVNSRRPPPPTVPAMTGPVLIPIPIRSSSPSSDLTRCWISTAAATAASACATNGCGAPNTASRPSPR